MSNSNLNTSNLNRDGIKALQNDNLQAALGVLKRGFVEKRAKAKARLPEFESLRAEAESIKNHVLQNLDAYLLHYEQQVKANGGHVHWAKDAASARAIVLDICRRHNARTVTKGKSMVGEEMHINEALAAADIEPIETDLGEYIIQLRNERPSHIIAPAVHVLKEEVADDFRATHTDLPADRTLTENQDLVKEARTVLRQKYLNADVGITGANFLIADSGTSVIVTNEGNGDLTQLMPKVHIVLAGIEKIVPNFNDVSVLLRLLARSATGQEMSSYTSFSSGAKRQGEADGAEEYHVVLLDNGRSDLLQSDKWEVLRCIRCGACMNHCPVYGAIGGHAYGSVYPGPIGAALTPGLDGLQARRDLPHASTFCGRCQEVCPMRIPLTTIMRSWRNDDFNATSHLRKRKFLLQGWAWLAARPHLYRFAVNGMLRVLPVVKKGGRLRRLPMLSAWQNARTLPAPQSRKSFLSQVKERK